MAIRVGWLPTGTQSAEDTRQAVLAMFTQAGLNSARVGIIPGTGGAQPFALTSTGSLSCSVGAGQGIVSPNATSTQGAYPVTVDATGGGLPSVSFSAGGSLARTDVIYLQVQDNAEDASGFTRGQVAVVQGANGGGVPSVPTGALALWQVPVPASASSINFATATFVGHGAVALGGVVPADDNTMPGSPYKGQVRARKDLTFTVAPGPLEVYDGTSWDPAVPNPYPRGRVAKSTISTAGSNSSNSTPVVYNTITTTLTSGRRYRVWCAGIMQNSAGNLLAAIGLYYISGASMPAGASGATNVITVSVTANANAPYNVSEEFVAPSSGTFTLAMTYNLGSGSGNVNVVTGQPQQIWLEDVGI